MNANDAPVIEQLKQLLNEYNQFDLALKLGVSQSYVSMLLTEKRKPSKSLSGRIKRLHNGTETQTSKWETSHGSALVAVSLTCPQMTAEEKTKLTKAIAYYAAAYMKAEVNQVVGLPLEKPKPLP